MQWFVVLWGNVFLRLGNVCDHFGLFSNLFEMLIILLFVVVSGLEAVIVVMGCEVMGL